MNWKPKKGVGKTLYAIDTSIIPPHMMYGHQIYIAQR